MMSDIAAIMSKELKEFFGQGGGRRSGKIGLLIMVGIPGVWLPAQMGRSWVSSPTSLFIAIWISLYLVISLVADAFAGERERHTLETLLASRLSDRAILFGKLAFAVCYGTGLTIAIMAVSLVVVNVLHGQGQLLMYSAQRIALIVVLSLLMNLLVAGFGILVSMRAATVRQAQQILSIAILAVFLVPLIGAQLLPHHWLDRVSDFLSGISLTWAAILGLVVLCIVDAILVGLSLVRFQRSRMSFD